MSPTLRAFYGALVGALIVLLAHSYSRPYLLTGVWFVGDSPFLRETSMLQENLRELPEPDSLEDVGLWVVTACERELTGHRLPVDDTLLILEVVQAAAQRDPDNAFWRQTEAVFQARLGNQGAALQAWTTASLASRWTDYQNQRLNGVLEGLERESGRNLGWHYALVESRKTAIASRAVLAFVRQVLRGDRVKDFDLRLATLRNGRLIRDGSRSVEASEMGVEMIEFAAYCTVEGARGFAGTGPLSPRTVTTARQDFLAAASEVQPGAEAEIREAFQDNDAREAFISSGLTESNLRTLSLATILTSTLPGGLVSVGLIGGVVFLFGVLLTKSRAMQRALTPPIAQALGVSAGLGVFFASGLFFPALWAMVSLGSFGVRRDSERQAVPRGLGSAYGLTIAILAIGFSLLLAVYFVSMAVPGEYLLEEAGFSAAPLVHPEALASLAAVVASLALVTASVWGFLARIPAERLAGPSLAKFGSAVALGCFAAGVALVPVAIALDKMASDPMSKIFQNEPTFYLTQ